MLTSLLARNTTRFSSRVKCFPYSFSTRVASPDTSNTAQYKVNGEGNQTLIIHLKPGESPSVLGGGVPLSGELKHEGSKVDAPPIENKFRGLLLHDLPKAKTKVAAKGMPGVSRVHLERYDNEILCNIDKFLCASSKSVQIEEKNTGTVRGMYSGLDIPYTLYRLMGTDHVFLRAPRLDAVKIKEDEVVQVPTENVVAFTKDMQYCVDRVEVEKGEKTKEMQLMTLAGPGMLWKEKQQPQQDKPKESSSYVPALVGGVLLGCTFFSGLLL